MTDQWPQSVGEIPTRPDEPPAFDPRMQAEQPPPTYPYQAQPRAEIQSAHIADSGQPPKMEVRRTRAEVLARRAAREAGVAFYLKDADMHARVRDLPFADRMMLMGIPADMRDSIGRAIGEIQRMSGTPNLAAALKLVDDQAQLDDAICIAGFVWPRLVRTEHERLQEIHTRGLTDDDVWLVADLHPDDKESYRDFVMRDRNGSQEDVARLAAFPGAGVVQAGSGGDRA